ncbi:MAG: hypothetical protein ACYCOR_19160 [Acidobacteriaceae bacterium]
MLNTADITRSKVGLKIPQSAFQRTPLFLDQATVDMELIVPGDFLYLDNNSTGAITVRFNNTSEPPLPMIKNFVIYGLPFKKVYVSWDAQPGLVANLWYAYEARVSPINATTLTLGAPVVIAQGSVINAPAVVALPNANQAYAAAAGAGTTWKQIIFKNNGNTNIYLGGAGVNASSPLLLPAQSPAYIEDRIAQADWYAYSDAAGGSLLVMTFQ